MPRSGTRSILGALLAPLLLATGCVYGFAGGGLPEHVRTIAIVPFENETVASELQLELTEELRNDFADRLGLREAPEARATAVIRGTIRRFEPDIPVAYSADPRQNVTGVRRRLQIIVDAELVDQTTGRILWQQRGLAADGEYSEGELATGRRRAVQKLVQEIIEGAQSQW